MATQARGAPRRTDPRIGLLVQMLDQAFDRKGWHGTTLRGAVRGVEPDQALWRPRADRHNIWELVLHTAYWKYTVRRRLLGEARGSFPRAPSNWPSVPEAPDEDRWAADLALLDAEHARLRELVLGLSPAVLDARSPRGTWTNAEQIHGIAAHDLYHTGQIQLLKRLMPENGVRRRRR